MERTLLALLVGVFWAGLYVYVPILSPFAASLGADLGTVGLVVGAYGVTQLLLRIPAGWLSDRWGQRKPFVAAGLVLTVVSSIMMALAPSPWVLVIGRALSGVSATMWVALTVLMAATFPADRAVAAMGLATFSFNIGQIAGTSAGGWLAENWGWTAPFFVSAGVGAAGLLLLLPVKDSGGGRSGGASLAVLGEILSGRRLLVISIISALMQYVTWVTAYGFIPVYAASIGASKAEMGWLTVATTLAQALVALNVGRIAVRMGVLATLSTGIALTAAYAAGIPYAGSIAVLMGLQVLGGVARGMTSPLLMGLSIMGVPAPRRAMAMGAYQSIYAAGMTLGPVVAGYVGRSFDMTGLFLSTAAVGLIALVGVWRERELIRGMNA